MYTPADTPNEKRYDCGASSHANDNRDNGGARSELEPSEVSSELPRELEIIMPEGIPTITPPVARALLHLLANAHRQSKSDTTREGL
jgi:hypothetical protein